MKIIHVAPYVSIDGAFGGPIAVAVAQLEELARLGHDVELVAGSDGLASMHLKGVKVSLFKATKLLPFGFSWLWSSRLLSYVRSKAADGAIVHIHSGRDLISLASSLCARSAAAPYFLQTHGMVMPDGRLMARVLDRVLVRKMLQRARMIFVLTEKEEHGLRAVAREDVALARVPNGIAVSSSPSEPPKPKREVLFLARLHPRKHVLAFAEMARIVIEKDAGVTFAVVGPDEGDLAALHRYIQENGLEGALNYEGPIPMERAKDRLREASIYVLPSKGEVFPMTVLESLSVGTPVVTTDDSGIAGELQALSAALITDGSPEALAEAVEKILASTALRERLAINGLKAVEKKFSIAAVGRQIEHAYQQEKG